MTFQLFIILVASHYLGYVIYSRYLISLQLFISNLVKFSFRLSHIFGLCSCFFLLFQAQSVIVNSLLLSNIKAIEPSEILLSGGSWAEASENSHRSIRDHSTSKRNEGDFLLRRLHHGAPYHTQMTRSQVGMNQSARRTLRKSDP